jgi:NAD(P)-dependent dehydrogenase (short-subunit alcohol dehydrogenase family)
MDLGLMDKIAVVTGASAGIGLAVCEALVREGAHVVAGARHSSPSLDRLAASGSATVVLADLTTAEGAAALVDAAGGRVHVLVNNVGGSTARPDGFAEVTDEQWLMSLTLNLMAAVRTTRAVLPRMLTAGGGSIITIGSANADLPDPRIIDYGAAKAALVNFTKALSKEVGGSGIRVNTVNPGPVATSRWRPDQIAAVSRRMVTGRLTRPDEVADVVVMLASNRTGNVTGATWAVDGGLVPTV